MIFFPTFFDNTNIFAFCRTYAFLYWGYGDMLQVKKKKNRYSLAIKKCIQCQIYLIFLTNLHWSQILTASIFKFKT